MSAVLTILAYPIPSDPASCLSALDRAILIALVLGLFAGCCLFWLTMTLAQRKASRLQAWLDACQLELRQQFVVFRRHGWICTLCGGISRSMEAPPEHERTCVLSHRFSDEDEG